MNDGIEAFRLRLQKELGLLIGPKVARRVGVIRRGLSSQSSSFLCYVRLEIRSGAGFSSSCFLASFLFSGFWHDKKVSRGAP
jgi:hypothetical protein